MNLISRYTKWLHTCWPAGTVEKLPQVDENNMTNISGVYVVGDLTGIPLLKFSADTGAKAIFHMQKDSFTKSTKANVIDVAIIGAGVSGVSAAIEAKKAGLSYKIFEATEIFSTIVNFPQKKPIYTYPTDMTPAGGLNFTADVKEELIAEMKQQQEKEEIQITHSRITEIKREKGNLTLLHENNETTHAQKVIIAIGRSGNFRKIGCTGENLSHVYNRLHDPKEFCGKKTTVVGGGDSALETAIAITCCGGHVTLSYRKSEFSRPKPDNIEKLYSLQKNPSSSVSIEKPISERVTTATNSEMRDKNSLGSLTIKLGSNIKEITDSNIIMSNEQGNIENIPSDAVFCMIGREAPLDFFRRSKININGEWRTKTWATFIYFFVFCTFIYHWKSGSSLVYKTFKTKEWFPFNVPNWFNFQDASVLTNVILEALQSPGFYVASLYTILIIVFGIRRIKRRKTAYVKWQTITLAMFQVLPLFLLPYILLPLAGGHGWFDSGWMKSVADHLFPLTDYGREYWRSYGLIFAWPLFAYNVFTNDPMWVWLGISLFQTFVFIPFIVWKWGKGAYCSWICSCGALAETLGDAQRHKMPHGPKWNRLNMVGQIILWTAFFLLFCRILSWTSPKYFWFLGSAYYKIFNNNTIFNYVYIVDLLLAGVIGVAMYFWFSGRIWCRFACPLAALMHIYARFSKFRIFSEKSKCISCNVCTSVCHQGIDVMNFANKGLPMQDPECVRCSACVQECPTGTLSFGELLKNGKIAKGWLEASLVQAQEK